MALGKIIITTQNCSVSNLACHHAGQASDLKWEQPVQCIDGGHMVLEKKQLNKNRLIYSRVLGVC